MNKYKDYIIEGLNKRINILENNQKEIEQKKIPSIYTRYFLK